MVLCPFRIRFCLLTPFSFRFFRRSLQGTRSCKKQAQKQASDEQTRLNGIQKKKDQLVEAHVHEQTIDAKTFREHMDRLREQEAMAKLERYDAELEDLDAWAAASSPRAFEHQRSRVRPSRNCQ